MLLKHFHQFNSKIFCSSNSTKICPSMRSKIQGVSFLPGNGTSQNKVLGSTVLQFVCLSQITHALQAVQEKFSSPTTVCNNKFFPSFPPHGDCDLQLWDSSPKVPKSNPKIPKSNVCLHLTHVGKAAFIRMHSALTHHPSTSPRHLMKYLAEAVRSRNCI